MKLRKKFNKVTAWILTCILFFTMAFSITSEAYGEGYTHAKQFKNCHIYNGIDVSTWNKQIDWNAVKASGIDFAFIKVGGRGWGSAGTLYHDSRALENLKGAKAAGIKFISSRRRSQRRKPQRKHSIRSTIFIHMASQSIFRLRWTLSMPVILRPEAD